MYNPDVVPVEQATNNSKGNFFNFLENETVNMNTEETKIEAPTFHNDLQSMISTPEEKTSNEQLAENFNANFGNPVSLETPKEEDFDPVDLIDTLDPEYETKVEEKLGIDLKTAINAIRETKDALVNKGFNISIEETDLIDSYQFLIKINKN